MMRSRTKSAGEKYRETNVGLEPRVRKSVLFIWSYKNMSAPNNIISMLFKRPGSVKPTVSLMRNLDISNRCRTDPSPYSPPCRSPACRFSGITRPHIRQFTCTSPNSERLLGSISFLELQERKLKGPTKHILKAYVHKQEEE